VRDDLRDDRSGSPECERRKRGTQNQAIERSRGGLTTKTVALVDALGNLANFVLLPGQAHDTNRVEQLIDGVAFDALLADRAFDADWLLTELDARGASAIIPPKAKRKFLRDDDKHAYKSRPSIENFFSKIMSFRAIVTLKNIV